MSNDGEEENRLVGWKQADSNLDQSWALSLMGDWDSFTENSTTQYRTHGNAHEILTADSQSVTHDTKGNQTGLPSNLTTSTSGLTLEWDFENKLHAADVDGTSGADILQKFDALGRRVSRDDGTTTTVFVPSGQQTIADYTAGTAASSPTYRYVYASYIDEPVMRAGSTSTAKLYYHRNQQYSVTALTDTTGTISERYAYDAYGKLTVLAGGGTVLSASAYGNRYTYTGREWDEELGLYFYRARMYSPHSGRFVSRDPIGFVDGLSLYQGYFASHGVDPSGLEVTLTPGNAPACELDSSMEFVQGSIPAPRISTGALYDQSDFVGATETIHHATRYTWEQTGRSVSSPECGAQLNHRWNVTFRDKKSFDWDIGLNADISGVGVEIDTSGEGQASYGVFFVDFSLNLYPEDEMDVETSPGVLQQACGYTYTAWLLVEKADFGALKRRFQSPSDVDYTDRYFPRGSRFLPTEEWESQRRVSRLSRPFRHEWGYTGETLIQVCRKKCGPCGPSCPSHPGTIQ